MMLSWKVRYLDRADGSFKDRCLFLESDTLPPAERAVKEGDRKARPFREKQEKLANDLWERSGRLTGGPSLFLDSAREPLESGLRGREGADGE